MTPIDFEAHMTTDDGSVQRARTTDYHLVNERDSYLLAFEDSDHVHEVKLQRGENVWHGNCWILDDRGNRIGRCRGLSYHDKPCAHLWLVRSLADDLDVPHAITDGGNIVSDYPGGGHDGQVFGRPEGRI